MNNSEPIDKRRSVRAYRQEAPTRDQVMRILEDAHKAPSGSNLQPWEFVVVTGEKLKALRKFSLDLFRRDPRNYPSSGRKDDPVPAGIWERQKVLGRAVKEVVEEMGEEHLSFIMEGSLTYYDAPAVVLVFMDGAFFQDRLIDIGMAVENLILSATGMGLGTCAISMGALYQDEIKKFLGLEERKNLVLGVALGYPAEGSPINEFRSQRAPLDEVCRWLE